MSTEPHKADQDENHSQPDIASYDQTESEATSSAVHARLQEILNRFSQPANRDEDFKLFYEAIPLIAKLPEVEWDGAAQQLAKAMLEHGVSKAKILEAVREKAFPKSKRNPANDRAKWGSNEWEDTIVEAPKDEVLVSAVQNLFADNRFIKLVRKNVQKFHVGDWNVTELLALSVASLSIENTNGLQPKLSGESGKGKTHAAKSMLHLIHPSMYRMASFSSKALFYDTTLRSKTIIFSDDVNLPQDTEELVRTAMSNWNSPTKHMTLDAQRNSVILSLPARIVFWLTSVKTTSTLQLLNRQVEMNVDESTEQDRLVAQHQRKLSERGLSEFYLDEEVKLLREAFLHLNQIHHKIKIPFADNVKFSDVRNRRNLPIFFDFVEAYCILNYRARKTGQDGSLVAEKEDFECARELFETIAIQQVTKLNEKERLAARVIAQNTPCNIDIIADETGLSTSYVYELIHGNKRSGNRGLLEKIPELRFDSRNDINPQTKQRWGKNQYSLPDDWELLDGHEPIVAWAPELESSEQLRSPSDSFVNELRNEEKLYANSDSRNNSFKPRHSWYS
jgi:hypothetical protein